MAAGGQTGEGALIDGRYRVFGEVGSGGYSKVYVGFDEHLKREVALKVLDPARSADPGFVERFVSEARSAASVSHPAVAGVYDFGRSRELAGEHYMVMEYLTGGTLLDYFRRHGPLPESVAAATGADVAYGLAAVHRAGLVHRDLKPSNVLMSAAGELKLSDFGIATALSGAGSRASRNGSDRVVGTASYMAPEQIRGEGAGPESDLYSLGVLLYEALTGEAPFSGENTEEIFAGHLERQPLDPGLMGSSVSGPMAAVVLRLLSKEPAARYRAAADLAADLEDLAAGHAPPSAVADDGENHEAAHRGELAGRRVAGAALAASAIAAALTLMVIASMFFLGLAPLGGESQGSPPSGEPPSGAEEGSPAGGSADDSPASSERQVVGDPEQEGASNAGRVDGGADNGASDSSGFGDGAVGAGVSSGAEVPATDNSDRDNSDPDGSGSEIPQELWDAAPGAQPSSGAGGGYTVPEPSARDGRARDSGAR